MHEKDGIKKEKKKETKIGLQKHEKELKKAKKKDKVNGIDRKASKLVEASGRSGIEGDEDLLLQVNGSKDSVDSLGGRKENKKRHKEKKKERANRMEELVEGQRNTESCRDVPAENGEEERPKKHRKGKREKEDSFKVVKNVVDDGRERLKEGNHFGRESREERKLAVREKHVDEVRDEAWEGAESGGIVGLENDGGDKIKKKKRKRENVYDDVEGKVKTDEDGNRCKKKNKRKSENLSNGVEDKVKTDEGGSKSNKKKKMESDNVSDGIEDKMETDDVGDRSKKKKKKTKTENVSDSIEDKTKTDEEGGKIKKKKKTQSENVPAGVEDKLGTNEEGDRSKKKEKKKKGENVSGVVEDTDRIKNKHLKDAIHEGCMDSVHSKDLDKSKKDKSDKLSEGEDRRKDKKKKSKAEEQVSDGKGEKGKARTENDIGISTSENLMPKQKSKQVSFSNQVEVFDDGPSGRKSWKESKQQGTVQGKRFTVEEDKLVEEAVFRYIEEYNLGDDGLHMVLHCRSYPEVRNCWKEIAKAIPWRPIDSVYYRGHLLFERDEKRKWTEEEKQSVLDFYEKHGADWKKLSTQLNKHRFHCKDTWRRIKLMNMNKGRWKQEEYQNLFDLVNLDLRMRALEERKSKHGMLRDNICWQSISDRLATRNNSTCCTKWYKQLTSPMVDEGLWADTDDYRLLDALTSLDAACLEDVDWDDLLEHREGHICRKRWNQMVKHIGDYGKLSFSEQVEVLAKRYNPDCLEVREEFDSKPILP